jgi:broad specificity phosphatase PhoE
LGLGVILPSSGTSRRAYGAQAGATAQRETRPTTVVLVRHAEKASDGTSDPPLTEAGEERARELSQLLSRARVSHLFASEFRRTQATLAPLAAAQGKEVFVRPARASAELALELAGLPEGSLAVVAGHSNTVPALVQALGGAADALTEQQYDRLFVVTRPAAGPVATLELSYGARAGR